ncbi:MAG: clan AA aspartic protease [Alphaproteobacteria bacterium]|nr:clan AA aspartic protease [Alphaproteobacteria bacterium]MBL6937827.1 clan AA aspartic protease [Alphaproteobacteria bacterium]MBL7099347.1 clan AA aspartic protease [Alphaproteobacteria bacterium]
MIIRLVGATMLAALLASPAMAERCGLQEVASYNMLPTNSGHVVIRMKIGDADENMVIDTGAWFSYLTFDTAAKLKLPTRSMSDQFVAYDAYGRRTSEVATAPSIEIGPLQVTSVDFVMAPQGADYGEGVAGLLGANVLKNFDLDFDFKAKRVNFFSSEHCPGQVVYWSTSGATKIPFKFDGSAISLPIELDGKTLYAELDTGAPASTITAPMALQMFGLSPGQMAWIATTTRALTEAREQITPTPSHHCASAACWFRRRRSSSFPMPWERRSQRTICGRTTPKCSSMCRRYCWAWLSCRNCTFISPIRRSCST